MKEDSMDENALKQEIMTVDERIAAVVVCDAQTYEVAGKMVIDLDGLKKKIEAYWKEPIEKAFQAHKALTAKRGEMLKPVDDRRKTLTQKISAYLTEEDRKRREEQRRLDEKRREAEQKERDRLAKLAAKAEEKGKIDKAEALREKAEEVYIPPAVVVPEVERTTRMDEGTVSTVKDIEIEIVDVKAVLRAVVDGKLPVSIVTVNDAKLKKAIKDFDIKVLDGVVIREVVKGQFRGAK
jgi:hypothetical protein